MSQVKYNPNSFGSIMRAIHTLLVAELEPGSSEVRMLMVRHIRLRARIESAYRSQFVTGKPINHAVTLADMALVCLRRVEQGATHEHLLKISKGKLVKLARKGLE